jgi:RNA polymerase sigma factor FliA
MSISQKTEQVIEEYEALWKSFEVEHSPEIKNKLILNYIWLVKYVIQGMNLPVNTILNDEDFLSIGIVGLHESIERFSSERGVKFESYAIPRIKGIIQDELRRLDWLSRTARKRASDYIQAGDILRKEVGREVSTEEIRRKLNVSPEEYQSYLAAAAAAKASLSLSESYQIYIDDEEINMLEEIPDDSQNNTLLKMQEDEKIAYITGFIKKLNEKKRLVISLYYYENLTFKEIGQILKVSESRICQIHTQVIAEMRNKMHEFANA